MKKNMKYPYLEGQIVERNVSKSDIAQQLGISQRSLCNKLNGTSEFTWSEVLNMQAHFFNDVDIGRLMRQIESSTAQAGRAE